MDPDATLRLLRATIKQMLADEDPRVRRAHAQEAAEHFQVLDEWLSNGGFLPEAWNPARWLERYGAEQREKKWPGTPLHEGQAQ